MFFSLLFYIFNWYNATEKQNKRDFMGHFRFFAITASVMVLSSNILASSSEYVKNYKEKGKTKISFLVQKQLKNFSDKYKRFPTQQEQAVIMRDAGCQVSYSRCRYEFNYYTFDDLIQNISPKTSLSPEEVALLEKQKNGKAPAPKVVAPPSGNTQKTNSVSDSVHYVYSSEAAGSGDIPSLPVNKNPSRVKTLKPF